MANKNILFLSVILALAAVGVLIFIARTFGLNRNLNAKAPGYERDQAQSYILVEEVKSMLENQEDFILLDVRTEEDYANEHIEGSMNIPYADLPNKFVLLPESKLIVTMDDGGDCNQSLGAILKLRQFGFNKLKNMNAGINAWKELKYPLVQGPAKPEPFAIAKISPDDMQARISEGRTYNLVDLRSEEEYISRHLPTARFIEYGQVKSQFLDNTLEQGKEIILYDDKEIRSELMAAELLKLGANNVKIIEGGITSWIQAGKQVVTE